MDQAADVDMMTLQMPTLGRPFSLGMLYDCRDDKLIPGITLWNLEELKKDIATSSQDNTSFEILASDTVSDKSSTMNITASLKASFLGGLIQVGGAATYMNDNKMSKNQARVTLKYSRTTKFEQLCMSHLGSQNIIYNEVFDKGTATHVVTGILYGADAFFIFDQEVSTPEDTEDIQDNLNIMIKKIPTIKMKGNGSLSMNDNEKEMCKKFSCTFHGDVALDFNPVNYEESVKIFVSLSKALGPNGEKAVPVKVLLYPLKKLDNRAAQLVQEINVGLVYRAEHIIQHLEDINMQCNDLIKHPAAVTFPGLKKKIIMFRKQSSQLKLNFQKQLVKTLPSIRGGETSELELVDILTNIEQSPLGSFRVDLFLSTKHQEMDFVKSYLNALSNVKILPTDKELKDTLRDPTYDNVVCFNFSLINENDQYLQDVSKWLDNQYQGDFYKHEKPAIPWFKNRNVRKMSRQYLKAFQTFAQTNESHSDTCYFISCASDPTYPEVSIHLYECGELVNARFEPRSEPKLPVEANKMCNDMELLLKQRDLGKQFEGYNVEDNLTESNNSLSLNIQKKQEKIKMMDPRTDKSLIERPCLDHPLDDCQEEKLIPGLSETSEVLNQERTFPTSPPEAIEVTAGSSTLILHWKKPAVIGDGVTVEDYVVEYKEDVDNGQQDWIAKKIGKKEEKYIIEGLIPMTPYLIRVSAECGDDGLSPPSNKVQVSTLKEHIKHVLLKKSSLSNNENPSVYQLATDDCKLGYQQYRLGEVNPCVTNRVILLIGATGTGKTTLINGMANYILGVDWEDNFRFKLVREVTNKSQAHSQTSLVTAYQMNYEDGYKIPYTLTLIDTPGFGDTRGIEHDKKITEAIHKFFTTDGNIDHIDAVCFVVQASLARLTQTQKYIFNSVFSIFGKDIKDNILILINFSDGQRPPVLEAIKTADIPYSQDSKGDPVHFKFNNSALFANNQTSDMSFDLMFWKMGKHSMEKFFTSLAQKTTQSLTLTKEVLKERKELEVTLQALLPQIKCGLTQLDAIRQTERALQQHKLSMEANKDFHFEITVTVPIQEDTGGEFITNCQKCNFTCHFPCAYGDDTMKILCCAIRNGICTICPNKCVWSVHFNQKYRWIYEERKEKRTYEEIKKNFEKASGEVMTTEKIFTKLNDDYKIVRQNVFILINQASQSLTRLHEIALRPDPLTTTEYIDMMIESEKQDAKSGFQERIKSLTEVKEMAELIKKIEKGEQLLPKEENQLPEGAMQDLVNAGKNIMKTFRNKVSSFFTTSKTEGERFTN